MGHGSASHSKEGPQNGREPDGSGQVVQGVERCDGIAAVSVRGSGYQGCRRGPAFMLEKEITKEETKEKVDADKEVEG